MITEVLNYIAGEFSQSIDGSFFDKLDPHSGVKQARVARSKQADVKNAVQAAKRAQVIWDTEWTPVKRGEALFRLCQRLEDNQREIADIVSLETGKSRKDAFGEVGGAIGLGRFFAGEGQRFFGRTTTSGMENRYTTIIREPLGVAGLIAAANTPIANVAWKVFPALICGNGVVMKAAEDTPQTAAVFANFVHELKLPKGIFNVVQGLGSEAGDALVRDSDVTVISFTGSTRVGKLIGEIAAQRLARVSLELGGKNPLVVCDDADLDNAVKWAALSAFSNAGQRCASASRILIFESVYDEFKRRFIEKAQSLKVGKTDQDDLGPVINERQLNNMLNALRKAADQGARILTGGHRLIDSERRDGYYLAPTILEGADLQSEISREELFGPITCLYKVKNLDDAIRAANDNPYGLTASIHTTNLHRATVFSRKVQAGVVVVNGGTYGSEPHMPFGGVKQSGNGSREPGPEALDVYSNLKVIYNMIDPTKV